MNKKKLRLSIVIVSAVACALVIGSHGRTEPNGAQTMKQLMTYQEYLDLGIAQGVRHDIDPTRMVWVVQEKHTQPVNVFGYEVDQAIVTTVHDAETGDLLEQSARSEDPHGLDQVQRRL